MAAETKINWYRSPVDRETLARLNQRSDWKGFVQIGGYLAILCASAAAAWLSSLYLPWPVTLLLIFVHGEFCAFLINGFHELVHKSVFKTKILNQIFLQIYSFLSWNNPVLFWTSHQEHHKFTLHPPDDLEVTLPVRLNLSTFLRVGLFLHHPRDIWAVLRGAVRLCLGKIDGTWYQYLFPPEAAQLRRELFSWSRLHLAGELALVLLAVVTGWWQLLVLVVLIPFYGGGLQYLCNNAQHSGLQDNVADYRLCTRTIYLNPVVRFLYCQMNYHIEHHMYAAVPCYNLAELHRHIKADLPPTPNGLAETWKLINAIMDRQAADPRYVYVPELPSAS